MRKLLSTLAVVLLLAAPAVAVPVKTAISLVIDRSGSMDTADGELQYDGYVSALKALVPQDGSVALSTVSFSTLGALVTDWTVVTSDADIDALFPASLDGAGSGSTNIAAGMREALSTVGNVAFSGLTKDATFRLIMDVSGDGKQNIELDGSGGLPTGGAAANALVDSARDDALMKYDVINGLAITDDFADLVTYYTDHVAGGSGSFVFETTFATFETAIGLKLERELDPVVPEPGTMALLGLGLCGLGVVTRRRRRLAA